MPETHHALIGGVWFVEFVVGLTRLRARVYYGLPLSKIAFSASHVGRVHLIDLAPIATPVGGQAGGPGTLCAAVGQYHIQRAPGCGLVNRLRRAPHRTAGFAPGVLGGYPARRPAVSRGLGRLDGHEIPPTMGAGAPQGGQGGQGDERLSTNPRRR